jgi:hypothetical protein
VISVTFDNNTYLVELDRRSATSILLLLHVANTDEDDQNYRTLLPRYISDVDVD